VTHAIEKGIPIPKKQHGGESKCKYAWPKLGDTDSIWYKTATESQLVSIRASARQWLRFNRPGWVSITRREKKNGKDGIRVWYVESIT